MKMLSVRTPFRLSSTVGPTWIVVQLKYSPVIVTTLTAALFRQENKTIGLFIMLNGSGLHTTFTHSRSRILEGFGNSDQGELSLSPKFSAHMPRSVDFKYNLKFNLSTNIFTKGMHQKNYNYTPKTYVRLQNIKDRSRHTTSYNLHNYQITIFRLLASFW